MISRILINNSPAFKLLELELRLGFNVFSGASGSGKSVFMESMLAIFGIKDSNADLIEANILTSKLRCNFEELGILEGEEEIVLSILRKEKTRYFINHQSSSKKRLNEIIDGFGKHISTRFDRDLKSENVRKILDFFIIANNKKHAQTLSDLEERFNQYREVSAKIKDLQEEEKNIEYLKDMARYEIQKIRSLNPKEGEYEELLGLKKILSKKEKILYEIARAREVIENLGSISNFLALVDEKSPSFFEGIAEVEGLLDDKESELLSMQEMDADELVNRISELGELVRKYNSLKEALEHARVQEQKLEGYENISFDIKKYEQLAQTLLKETKELADLVHEERVKYVGEFCIELNKLCIQLKLSPARIDLNKTELSSSGIDDCDLFIGSSNHNMFSAGEHNRARLALMCVEVSVSDMTGILVLDEIDANLSGEESEGVAKILKQLSSHYQIFAISHQPHMPALADNHYLVYKDGDKSHVKLLDFEGRVQEIARMISGSSIDVKALDFARATLSKKRL